MTPRMVRELLRSSCQRWPGHTLAWVSAGADRPRPHAQERVYQADQEIRAPTGNDQTRTSSTVDVCRPISSQSQIIRSKSQLFRSSTRYVMLVKLGGKDTETVVNALIKNVRKLPQKLY